MVPMQVTHLPWRLILVVVAIGSFGGLVLYSAAGGSMKPWALNHFIRFFALLGVAIGMSYVRPQTYRDFAFPFYGAVIVLLIVVQAVGAIGGGARSWLEFGFIRIQPSELMKPALVLVLASFYASLPASEVRKFNAIWPAALLLLVPDLMVLIQPDLGTAMLLIFSALTVMFLAGLPLRLFVGGGLAVAALIPIAYSVMMPHQQRRVLIFLDPSRTRSARLSPHPVQDRDRIGRHLRQGLPQRDAEPSPLSSRAAYRFHLFGDGRGMGTGRRPVPDPVLRLAVPLGNGGGGGKQGQV
jgi:rod shape determining protein RodA